MVTRSGKIEHCYLVSNLRGKACAKISMVTKWIHRIIMTKRTPVVYLYGIVIRVILGS